MVIPLCGGNIDTTVLGRCLDRGLAADGRLVKFSVTVSDRPGGISDLAKYWNSILHAVLFRATYLSSQAYTSFQFLVRAELELTRHFGLTIELLKGLFMPSSVVYNWFHFRLLSSCGVSIKDMVHERAWLKNDIFCVEVSLPNSMTPRVLLFFKLCFQCIVVVETRDAAHAAEMVAKLKETYTKLSFTGHGGALGMA